MKVLVIPERGAWLSILARIVGDGRIEKDRPFRAPGRWLTVVSDPAESLAMRESNCGSPSGVESGTLVD